MPCYICNLLFHDQNFENTSVLSCASSLAKCPIRFSQMRSEKRIVHLTSEDVAYVGILIAGLENDAWLVSGIC